MAFTDETISYSYLLEMVKRKYVSMYFLISHQEYNKAIDPYTDKPLN